MASTSAGIGLKRTKTSEKNAVVGQRKSEPVLELSDVTCPICLDIRVEPVTMPCGHELCLACFKQHVQKASLRCPLCRLYISNWARKMTRLGTLVNQQRWRTIQQYFPEKVHNRVNCIDDDSEPEDENDIPRPSISDHGEIRKEYESQMNKLIEETEKQRLLEEAKSEQLIRMLTRMDERDAQKVRLDLLRLTKDDSTIARALSDESDESLSAANRYVPDSEFRHLNDRTPRAESLPSLDDTGCQLSSAAVKGGRKRGRPFLRTGFAAPAGSLRNTRAASKSVHSASGVSSTSSVTAARRSSSSASLPLCLEKFSVDVTTVGDIGDDDDDAAVGLRADVPRFASGGIFCPLDGVTGKTEAREFPDVVAVDSEDDSISGELCHFRPIKVAPKTPPMCSPDGSLFEPALVHTKPRNLSIEIESNNRHQGAPPSTALLNRIAQVHQQRWAALSSGTMPLSTTTTTDCVIKPTVFPLTPTNVSTKGLVNRTSRNSAPDTAGDRNDTSVVVDAANKENPFVKPTTVQRKTREEPVATRSTKRQRQETVTAPPPTTTSRRNDRRSKVKANRVDVVNACDSAHLEGTDSESAKRLCSMDTHKTRAAAVSNQLESDRQMALQLEREWSRLDRLVDRRAGSDGQYQFRSRARRVN